jgi:type I restriction enzyme, S subunit
MSRPLAQHPAVIVGRKGSAGALNLCDGPSWTTDVAYFVEPPPFFSLRFLFNALATLDLDKLGKGVKPGLSRSDAYEQIMWVRPPSPSRTGSSRRSMS